MGSIWNTLKYGDSKTKKILYLLLGIACATLICGILASLFHNQTIAILGIIAFVTDLIVLLHTNFKKQRISEKSAHHNELNKHSKQTAGEMPENQEPNRYEPDTNPLLQYDEQKLKKLLVAYKVRREHVPIMVDSCMPERIQQCPAYLWKDNVFLYFLFITQEPKIYKCLLQDAAVVKVKIGANAKPSAEYQNMKEKSLIGKVFSKYLPKYYRGDTSGYKVDFRKNLYLIGNSVWCTAASMENVFKIISAEVELVESKINSTTYSIYFRDIYISRVLFRDAIITAQTYKQKVQDVLTTLSEADISEETFQSYLAQMVIGGLIPQEYSDFAIAKRVQKNK